MCILVLVGRYMGVMESLLSIVHGFDRLLWESEV